MNISASSFDTQGGYKSITLYPGQTWGKHLTQMLGALLQALEKCLSTSTSTNTSIK